MSFSTEVKEELFNHIGKARHCQIAQLAGIFAFCGRIVQNKTKSVLRIQTENISVINAAKNLITEAFGEAAISFVGEDDSKKGNVYIVECADEDYAVRILKAIKFIDEDYNINLGVGLVDSRLIQQICCKRAFVRGAFLAAGSISDPEKGYHFEIVCQTINKAEQMRDVLNCFDLDAKIVERKNHYVTYIKEGDKIVDVLNVMEAYISLMKLENVRIVKEMRNNVNRQVNCETANINKTVSAAFKQREDIEYIQNTIGLESLTPQLREVAILRLENSEASLNELVSLSGLAIGKSGMNHRLRKISLLAEELREKRGGYQND